MNAANFDRAGDIFLEARELPAEERAAFLERTCGQNTELRTEVESLLAGDERASLLDHVKGLDLRAGLRELARETGNTVEVTSAHIPERIDQYRIIRKIGQGGMGTVYEAEQESPKRTVALKVLSTGIQSSKLLGRFRREAEVLARLHHPGIAQIYQSGITDIQTDTGASIQQAWFAMELIKGEPLDVYARRNNLDVPARLQLFAKICDAVSHAHEQGVIHRDLKPANILVDQYGQPKILDFGVARVTNADMRNVTLQTEVGQLVGTLSYMSPEQTGGDSRELDERSDVYALGIILYELLAGELPYGLRNVSIPDAARVIREVEPTRLGSVDTHFRGDVETIVTKTLEKDRLRRYQSAAELAADIRRHLSDEPIKAKPVSTFYQLRKFTRRNRVFVAGLATTFLALAVGLIGTISNLREAHKQRDAAVAARAEAERVAEFQAQVLSGLTARDFGDALLDDLRAEYRKALEEKGTASDEIESRYNAFDETLSQIKSVNIGRTVLSSSQAERAITLLEKDFTDNPVTEARLRKSIGNIYDRLGMYSEAADQFEKVIEIRRNQLGPDHPDTLEAMYLAAMSYRNEGLFEKAEPLFRDALERQGRVLGRNHRDTLQTMAGLSRLLVIKFELDEAEELLLDVVDSSKRTLGSDDDFTLDRMNELGLLYLNQGRFDQAIESFRELLDVRQNLLGPDHSKVILIRNNLMSTLFRMNRLAEAEPIASELVATSERTKGRNHPDTIMARNNHGIVLFRLGRLNEAEHVLRASYQAATGNLNPENEIRMKTTSNLVDVLLAQKNPSDAEEYCDELLSVRRALIEPRPGLVAQTLEQRGWACYDQKKYNEARDAWQECTNLREQLSSNHWLTNRARSELGMALTALHNFDQAEAILTDSYNALKAQREDIPPGDGANCIDDAATRLVELYKTWGKLEKAGYWSNLAGDNGTQ